MKRVERKMTRPLAYRARRILEMIRETRRDGTLPSATDFAVELDVSWHTIIRDLNYLRDDEGAPIAYDASRKGYYLEDRGWTLQPVTLNQREVFAFSVASRMLQPFRGTPLEMDMKALFGKIGQSLSGRVTLSADALTDRLTIIHDDYVPLNRDIWIELAGYIERGQAIRVRYRRFDGCVRNYLLLPVHLVAYHGNWYVVAFSRGKSEPRMYALSRIRGMSKIRSDVAVPKAFDIASFLAKSQGVAASDEAWDVRLRFSRKVATYISERVWHPSQVLTQNKDGSVEVAFTTRGWKELVRWVLSWQPDVEVVAPVELRQRVCEKMVEGARLNATGRAD